MNLAALISGVQKVAGLVYPPAVPFLSFLEKVAPYADQAMPLIKAAIHEGPAAFAAVKASAPEFFHELSNLTAAVKAHSSAKTSTVSEADLAVVASHLVGLDPPGWTHEATEIWWNRDKASFT